MQRRRVKHAICTEHHQPLLHFRCSADYSLLSSLLNMPVSGVRLYLTDTLETESRLLKDEDTQQTSTKI